MPNLLLSEYAFALTSLEFASKDPVPAAAQLGSARTLIAARRLPDRDHPELVAVIDARRKILALIDSGLDRLGPGRNPIGEVYAAIAALVNEDSASR